MTTGRTWFRVKLKDNSFNFNETVDVPNLKPEGKMLETLSRFARDPLLELGKKEKQVCSSVVEKDGERNV